MGDQVDELVRSAVTNQERAEVGLPVEQDVNHLIFAGPSGTGKTTVARKIAPLYNALGLLPSDKFVEVNPADLYGEYQGETQQKVKRAFEQARGGVLFIDEAYGLLTGKDDSYGKQAITSLISMMNDKDTVVILGGYPKEMKDFLKANEGLSRRFSRTIDFPSYDQTSRADILFSNMDSEKYQLASPELMDAIDDAVLETGGGNAGDVKNLWASIKSAQQKRLESEEPAENRKAQLSTITASDIRSGVRQYKATANVEAPLRGTLVPTSRKKAS